MFTTQHLCWMETHNSVFKKRFYFLTLMQEQIYILIFGLNDTNISSFYFSMAVMHDHHCLQWGYPNCMRLLCVLLHFYLQPIPSPSSFDSATKGKKINKNSPYECKRSRRNRRWRKSRRRMHSHHRKMYAIGDLLKPRRTNKLTEPSWCKRHQSVELVLGCWITYSMSSR